MREEEEGKKGEEKEGEVEAAHVASHPREEERVSEKLQSPQPPMT